MADGRKNNGGRRSNAVRKSRTEEAEIAQLLEECWTDEDRHKCIKALVARTNPVRISAWKPTNFCLLKPMASLLIDRKSPAHKANHFNQL
jgi:hypothetical protein